MNEEYLRSIFECGVVSAFDGILCGYHAVEPKLQDDSEKLLLLLGLIEQGKESIFTKLNSREHGKEMFEAMQNLY